MSYSYLGESFKLRKYYLITACMKYNPAWEHWMPTSQSRKLPSHIKGNASLLRSHEVTISSCEHSWQVSGFRLVQFGSSLYYDITRRTFYLFTDVSGQTICPVFKGQRFNSWAQLQESSPSWLLKMRRMGSAETSVTNDQTLPHNILEERRSPWMISGFHPEVNGVCALLWCYIAYSGKELPLYAV